MCNRVAKSVKETKFPGAPPALRAKCSGSGAGGERGDGLQAEFSGKSNPSPLTAKLRSKGNPDPGSIGFGKTWIERKTGVRDLGNLTWRKSKTYLENLEKG